MKKIDLSQLNQATQAIKDDQLKLTTSFIRSVDLLLAALLKKLIKTL